MNTGFQVMMIAMAFFVSTQNAIASNRPHWMWYPGHLGAWFQQVQRTKSAERCVNVGYPGNFFAYTDTVYFKKGEVVKTIIRPQQGIAAFYEYPEGWLVSCDSIHWVMPERDSRYIMEEIRPEVDIDQVITIQPQTIMPLRNAVVRNGTIQMGRNAMVVVDFQELEVGTVKLQASGAGTLTLVVGESIEEVMNDNIAYFEQYPIKPQPVNEFPSVISSPERALRYVRLVSTEECMLDNICFDTHLRPVKRLFQFECSDSMLNNLFETGVKTLHTSMHNFYLDGIKRDYLPWAMDAVISAIGGCRVFGDRQVERNGISLSLMPLHPKVSDWGIVDYPLHALIALKEEYLRYGDLSTSLMYRDRIVSQMSFYENQMQKDGLLHAEPPTTGFIPGWARKNGPDDYGVAAYAQMMLYENFRIAAFFAEKWNDNLLARNYKKRAALLKHNIMAQFWDEKRGAFINGIRVNGEIDMRLSRHAQYWAILTDLFPKEYVNHLFDKVLPAIPYYKEWISYEKGYELLAYIKADKIAEAYELLNEVWGDWLKQGYTRFPENFSLGSSVAQQLSFYERPFGLSLCHGANGVPPIIVALYGIIGFSQDISGKAIYTIRPQLLHLDWVKARIPIKEGFIEVYIRKDGTCDVKAPKGCRVNVLKQKH